MKRFKKVLCLLLALTMIAALGVSAWAAEGDVVYKADPSLKVNTHNFIVYQLLTGTPRTTTNDEGETILIKDSKGEISKELDEDTVKWGADMQLYGDQKKLVDALKKSSVPTVVAAFAGVTTNPDTTAANYADPIEVARAFYTVYRTETTEENLATMAKEIHTAIKDTGDASQRQTANSTKNRATGYYLLFDEDAVADGQHETLYVHVTDGSVNPKTIKDPQLNKQIKVKGTDKTAEPGKPALQDDEKADYDKGAVYAKGDTVEFKISSVLPEGYENKADYWIKFTDTQDLAFSTPEAKDIKVYVKDYTTTPAETDPETGEITKPAETTYELREVPSSKYTLTITGPTEAADGQPAKGAGFTLEILNMRDDKADNPFYNLKGVDKDEIVVIYNVLLNGDLVLGNPGNVNKVNLDYLGRGEDPLPESSAKAFTFEFDANKIDGSSGEPLEDAKFALYKHITVPAGFEATDTEGVYKDAEGNTYDTTGTPQDYIVDTTTTGEGDGASTTVTAVYELVEEITTPDVTFDEETGEKKAVTFGFKGLEDGVYRLVETKAPETYNAIDPIDFSIDSKLQNDKSAVTELTLKKSTGNITGNIEDGTVTMPIANYKGVVLPETGGIGTTLFYIGGAVLLLGAAVLLITKRRAKFDED